jgi:hypothetical protein
MELYIVQWFNTENLSEIGAEVFTDEGDAEVFLEGIVHRNYSKTHPGTALNDDDPDYDQWRMNEVLDSKALRPYVYKIVSKKMYMQFK